MNQMTLTGEPAALERACSHYGNGYEKGCNKDAVQFISCKLGAADVEMKLCQECAEMVADNADEVHIR